MQHKCNKHNKQMEHVIISNFGNDSVALIQWAIKQQLNSCHILSVDTGWSAPLWKTRVTQAQQWAEQNETVVHIIEPKVSFTQLMQTQGKFPSRKFQWCANFLKGLPILDWLDQYDPDYQATILLAHRRAHSLTNQHLQEHIEESEHYNDRPVWHPLYQHTDQQCEQLIAQTPLPLLRHRSLECDPCVNSDLPDVLRMDPETINKVSALEKNLQATLLDKAIYHGENDLRSAMKHIHKKKTCARNLFDMGCGSAYGCGS